MEHVKSHIGCTLQQVQLTQLTHQPRLLVLVGLVAAEKCHFGEGVEVGQLVHDAEA